MKGATILYTEMSPDIDWEDDFNHWYDTHHIPVRTEIPGLIGAQRYRDPDRPTYLAIYEISSPEVMESAPYKKVRAQPNAQSAWMLSNVGNYSRYVCNEIQTACNQEWSENILNSPFVYSVFYSVPDKSSEEFIRWNTEEFHPMLLKSEHWQGIRLLEISEGEPQPWTHLSINYLTNLDKAFDSSAFKAVTTTELYKKLSQENWFQSSSLVYERFGERFQKTKGKLKF